ncbi:MAG TPA: DUF929 family protein [Mycobacteriales bacterium]|jgi:hypothetical protein|nr:DUF929 family protein [Mycobacteriales bacterium]
MAQTKGQQRKTEARERARVRREQQRKAERRRKLVTGGTVIVAVVALVVALVVVKVTSGSSSDKNLNAPVSAALAGAISSVQPAAYDEVKAGSASGGMKAADAGDSPLTAGGKPEVLYVGGEFCPYCAAERWSLATALARFGTFEGLETTKSSSKDVYPNTATLSFLDAKYTSQYLTFTPREVQDRAGKDLQTLTDAQSALLQKYTQGSIPFIDFGGKYILGGAQYDPNTLKGLTADQIGQKLGDPASPIAQAILGGANLTTAAICKLTGGQPGSVCNSTAVTSVAGQLTSGSTDGSS